MGRIRSNGLTVVAIAAALALALGSDEALAHSLYQAHPFSELDTNHDGLISKAEYAAHSAKHAKRNPQSTPIADTHPFSELDPDNDGTISKKEYAAHSARHAKDAGHGHGTDQ